MHMSRKTIRYNPPFSIENVPAKFSAIKTLTQTRGLHKWPKNASNISAAINAGNSNSRWICLDNRIVTKINRNMTRITNQIATAPLRKRKVFKSRIAPHVISIMIVSGSVVMIPGIVSAKIHAGGIK